jgi:hypothetical protein
LIAGAAILAAAEFLSAVSKVRPAGHVKVALRDFRAAEQAVDGAEAGAGIERTGAFFSRITLRSWRPRMSVS